MVCDTCIRNDAKVPRKRKEEMMHEAVIRQYRYSFPMGNHRSPHDTRACAHSRLLLYGKTCPFLEMRKCSFGVLLTPTRLSCEVVILRGSFNGAK